MEQINRRLKTGECFHQPYLGTRECTAFFKKFEENEVELPNINFKIGNMLFDTAYCQDDKKSKDNIQFLRHKEGCEKNKRDIIWGTPRHIFFDANIENGKLIIPKEKYDELYRKEGFDAYRAG